MHTIQAPIVSLKKGVSSQSTSATKTRIVLSTHRTMASERSVDSVVTDGKSTDFAVIVIGVTGAGKSTFINTLLPEDGGMKVDHCSLKPCTINLEHATLEFADDEHPDRRLIVVDTPGFNGTGESDAEIWARIANWMMNSLRNGVKIAGIIYLQDITLTTANSATVYDKILYEGVRSNIVVLGMTKWTDKTNTKGEARLRDLKANVGDSNIFKFNETKVSALSMVTCLLKAYEENTKWSIPPKLGLVPLPRSTLKHLNDRLRNVEKDIQSLIKSSISPRLKHLFHFLMMLLHKVFNRGRSPGYK
ncbi:hypothetical protein BDQ17DRAFT_1426651 [Cyathus striatus]|nr:hypothetical protein BDQ17DRAFT_1426651 [Cyathus striatus]